MEPMQPEGLKQSPTKPFNGTLQKVEETKIQPINADIHLLDAIRLGLRKAIENKAFGQYQISVGKTIAVSGGLTAGIGSFASINWGLLLTGNVFEILKLISAFIGLGIALFWKK